jgi:hypothetical protein
MTSINYFLISIYLVLGVDMQSSKLVGEKTPLLFLIFHIFVIIFLNFKKH